jgi:deoxyribonuclease V
MIKPLHSWEVSIEEALQIQENLKDHLVLKKTFSSLETIGGADVAYSINKNSIFGAIVVLSYPEMEPIDRATANGKISFPYIPGLFSFREGPILLKAFESLRIKPDLMIFDGHGTAHPKGIGLASHMGLWFNIPSIGCARTSLLRSHAIPGVLKGSVDWIYIGKIKVGAVLRTRTGVKPVFVSPGHRIDLMSSIRMILDTCRGYRIPYPIRKAHQISRQMIHGI